MVSPAFFIKKEEESSSYGRFIFEPLHQSFGNSLGNSLRRTLLSSLPGAAIGYVKVKEAPHLFSSIKGVKESVLDIVLNMKQLRFTTSGEGPFRISISAKGAKKIIGRDCKGDATVVNDDQYIAEITDNKVELEIEAVVEVGYGFVASEEKQEKETGFITIDSAFSPVRRVNFKIEEARVGRKTNFERLILEVWTDESVSPTEALKQSAALLSSYYGHMFSGKDVAKTEEEQAAQKESSAEALANKKIYETIIDELNLPSRVINALLRENIETVADLVKRGKENLVGLKGVGKKSIDLIEEELQKMGIELE